ncbi:MAG: cytochrome c-type biogenesis CcmF C-terminal domain-containing protein, partial [Candidatus Limnocylindria bacterium]|nr:cytochrome c-type biogenesis CcmF C-terminal domain-containing protein [Candidatus Limnocylindria bacterium]
AATLTVLLGTLYPLIAEALSGAQLSIGRPYFDRVEVPLGLALLFLMGIGPQVPWHGASRATLEKQFTVPIAAGAAGALLAVIVGIAGAFAVLTYALGFFVAATVVQEFARGMQARHVLHGEGRAVALANLLRRNGRRYGGYIVHLGIVVIAVAVATSQAGAIQVEKTLSPGDSVTAGPYVVTLTALRDATEPQRDLLVADLTVTGSGANEHLRPALVFYPNSTQAIGSPGIAAGARDDVYTILVAYDTRAHAWATIRVLILPLVSWLWAGGAIVGLGAIIAALPQPKRRPAGAPSDTRAPAEV